MPVTILIAIAPLCVIAGAFALTLGVRGRRVNDHPICRRCRFDLIGVPSGTGRCSECGSDLSRAKAVRTGARSPRRGAILLAIPLLALGLAGSGAIAWVWGAGYNWYGVCPEWALESIANADGGSHQRGALGELANRLAAGDLDPARSRRLLDRALEVQADASRAWLVEWGDLIDMGIGAGLVAGEQVGAYLANACEYELEVRERVRAGDKIAVQIWMRPTRAGSATPIAIAYSTGPLLVDGEPAPGALASGQSRAYLRGVGGSSGRTIYHVFEGEPGVRTLAIEIDAELAYSSTFMPGQFDPDTAQRIALETNVEVVAPETQLVRMIDDPTLAEEIRGKLTASQFRVAWESEGATMLDGSVSGSDLPIDCVFDVFVRAGGREHRWAVLVIPAGGDHGVGTAGRIEASIGETVDLVLRGSDEALLTNTQLESAWGGEIVIEGVPVMRPGKPPDSGAPAD